MFVAINPTVARVTESIPWGFYGLRVPGVTFSPSVKWENNTFSMVLLCTSKMKSQMEKSLMPNIR